ncbi:MAG: phosphodiesterase [Firmicutes bacterium]|nr:phosphodiesterase [Bacillota bacterium]
MKYFVASDIHGSYEFAKIMTDRFALENADKLILLGDLYYHGPRNSLPSGHSPMDTAKLLNQFKDKIICVQGNCDAEVDKMISEFEFFPHFQLNLKDKHFFFSHGDRYNASSPPSIHFDILITGHEHIGYIKKSDDNKIFANCGSVSLPKSNSDHSYIVIENNTIFLKSLTNNSIIQQINFN